MPRTSKREDEEFSLDPEAVAAAVAEVQEDLRAEEVAAAFFAAQAKSGEGEAGEAVLDEDEAEPVLGEPAGEAGGGSGDSQGAQDEGDAEGGTEEPAGPPEPEVEAETPAPRVKHVRHPTSAERRPTTAGKLTVITQ